MRLALAAAILQLRTTEPDYQGDEAGHLFLSKDERTLQGYRA